MSSQQTLQRIMCCGVLRHVAINCDAIALLCIRGAARCVALRPSIASVAIALATLASDYLVSDQDRILEKELLRKVYSQRENNARIFQLSNEIENFNQGIQTLGMYYARLRSSWEELFHYDSFIKWPASAPRENVHTPPTAAEIYAKIVEKTRVF
ncbi:hypothetical protein GIB67_036221 [Kingdonia uniflora]|uniref:Uncharacterized protein n=1 Tax=Kingdonia uniflora TaxID=39325 RepID=A0A7J7LFB4_9MAGN|nr:hypothetical protein GIB67_036221 [Kingdonia uniflora]